MRPYVTRALEWARFLPGAALGLFVARSLGEAVGLPGLWAAVSLGAVLTVAGAWLLARRPLAQTWPALTLLAYVVQPEVRPDVWWWTLFVAVAAFILNWWVGRSRTQSAMTSRRVRWLIGGVLFVAALVLYVATLAPDVLAADSGELQTVAAQLGVAHPPGFPLYTVLAHLFTRLPFSSPAYAVNLFSAVTGALTVLVVYCCGVRLSNRILPALLGAAALGAATTFWSQATTANVRSLTALLAALLILVLVEFRIAYLVVNNRRATHWLIVAALLSGLGLTHHVSLAFLILVGLIFVIWVDPSLLRSPRRWWRPLLAGAVGLLPLLYLPLRAAADVRGASPALATWPGFVEHALATGFRGDLFAYLAPAELGPRLLIMGNVMAFQFAPLLLAGMALGLLWLLLRDRQMALLLGGAFAVYTFIAATYRAPQTVEYMMPAYVPAALLLAYGVARLPDLLRPLDRIAAPIATLFTVLVLATTLGQLNEHRSASGLVHEATSARDYAGALLADAPPDSVILAHWHWATPLWYLQEIEGQRPDVAVRFVFPEGEPYDTTWARRTAEEFAAGRPVITTWVPPAPPNGLPVAEPLGEALLYPRQPRAEYPPDFTPIELILGDAINVLAYRYESPSEGMLTPGNEAVITIAWQPAAELPPNTALFLHLVGEDSILYAQDDEPARASEGVTLTQFRLAPRPQTPIGVLTAYVGLSSDGQRQPLAELPVTAGDAGLLTRNPLWRRPVESNDETLIGYDWDHTLADRQRLYLHWRTDGGATHTQVVDDQAGSLALPPYRGPWGVPVAVWRFPRGAESGHYVPLGEGIIWTGGTLNGLTPAAGDSLTLNQEFRSGRPINRDYVVSVRLIGLEPDGFHWAWWDLQDSVPALGAIPTLKWVEGSLVRSPHRVTVAADAPAGQTLTGALTLYDAFTNRPLPILDERITDSQAWIPLCQAIMAE